MKMLALAGGLAVALSLVSTQVSTQEPVENIGDRHPNLRDAQRLTREAFNRITDAQNANEYDLGGHAGRAKELLREANEQLKQAAIHLNRR